MTDRHRPAQPTESDRRRTADLRSALDAIVTRAPVIHRHMADWQRGIRPAGTGGRGTVTDPMAERVATDAVPYRTDPDRGDDAPLHDQTTGRPVPHRPEPDPALDATIWCARYRLLLRLVNQLDQDASRLAPPCGHEDAEHGPCPRLATRGQFCDQHAHENRTADDPIRQCECCGQDVMGTTEDPMRRGLDKKCYDAWWRASNKPPFPDFDDWKRQRRAMRGADLPNATGQAHATGRTA